MKKQIIITIWTILMIASNIIAQNDMPKERLIDSYDMSLEFGRGGGSFGAQIKANHWWWKKKKLIVQSSLSYSGFRGTDLVFASDAESDGFITDNHLRVYSGIEQSFFKKNQMFVFLELYTGAYHVFTKGNYQHPDFSINRDYKSSTFIFDYGTRVGFGFRVKEKWGIQLAINNSWIQANNGLGVLAGLLAGGPDGKMSVGLGVNYRLGN